MTDKTDNTGKQTPESSVERAEQAQAQDKSAATEKKAEDAQNTEKAGQTDKTERTTDKEGATEKVVVEKNAKTPSQTTRSETVVVKEKGSKFSPLAFIAFLFALAALGACGWLYWQLEMQKNTFAKQQQSFTTQKSQLKSQLKQQSNELKQQQQAEQQNFSQQLNTQLNNQLSQFANEVEQKLQTQQQKMDKSIELINQSGEKARQQMLLTDIKNLINIASHKLFLQQDKQAALTALKMVQNRLAALSDSKFLAIKQSIAEDIGTLNALPSVNNQEIYYQLSELMGSLKKLPLNQAVMPTKTNSAEQTKPSSEISWDNLKLVWQDFLSLFRVQKRDTEIEPLLTPAQVQNIELNLLSKLNQAQWAALNAQSAVYQTALKQTAQWVSQYYDPTSPKVTLVIDRLILLANKQLVADYSQVTLNTPTLMDNTL
ncbi:uroporphyrinogen-III C-methyltransferase [Catenovulum sediminis]|uniref:Uroporphyrinogen-III C-methyltransferase n=1 Tax=Catenovulum sediminis TaxID=1740262 RepID=A0ABV1RHT8_9ALTE|nr:uroporphyrinogen-III C-methyltransferase [Catenovulum sediminis]